MQTTGWLGLSRDSRLRWLATGIWLAVMATLSVSVVIWASQSGSWQTVDLRLEPPSLLAITLTGVVFGSVGAFVARRAPTNAIGWLFLAISVGMAALLPVNLVLEASVHAFRPVPPVQLWLAWTLTSVQLPFSGAAIIAAVLLFPTGRTDWRFARPTLMTALAGAVLLSLAAGLRSGGLLWYTTLPNPAAAPADWRPLLTMVSVVGLVALIAALAAAASSLLWRYRYGDARQRRPLAWVMAGCTAMASAVAVLFAARYVGDTTGQSADLLLLIGAIGAVMLPLSMVRFTAITESHGRQVGDLTFLFTDLQDSTGMYERVGDVEAFDLVRLHFRVLEEATSGHHGAIVKTIGDAIMARFEEPREAVVTGLEMHRRLERFNQRSGSGLVLKVGVHRGPAIGVSSRGRVDYFGQAVNVAARVGAIAGAGELVLTEQVYQSPGVADLLADYHEELETVQLKGVAEPVSVYRFTGAPRTITGPGGEPAQAHRS
jgi:class 3 adenylate cyclase